MAPAALVLAVDEPVDIELHGLDLPGRLTVPERARGVVVFAHDAGTDALNLSDRQVAAHLHHAGFGTLLVDLAAPSEGQVGDSTFELDVLAIRLLVATRWLRSLRSLGGSHVGYLGVRAGAAVALLAAADDASVDAVVARSARLDLVASVLPVSPVPTLLVVGAADVARRAANERALGDLRGPHELAVVPGASELFVERGALDDFARLAGSWFERHLHSTATGRASRP